MPGPIPMRSSELSRERDADRPHRAKLTRGKSIPSKAPRASSKWGPAAKNLYDGMRNSGMAAYYEASDWALLHMLVDDIDHCHKVRHETGKMPAMLYSSLLASLNGLGITEGDRRKLRIELEGEGDADQDEEVTLTVISEYRDKLNAALTNRKEA